MSIKQQAQPALIFIPDISGFTQFVHDVEIQHSGHIVRELLETIIDANSIGLEISEIEGDAVLFYRMGSAPTASELLLQVRNMYLEFHLHLKRYESSRICHCGACSTAHKLQLKFIVHFGQLSTNKVKDHKKLFGSDVILAHRLLKNNIEHDEYLLITKNGSAAFEDWESEANELWANVRTGSQSYDLGTVDYLWVPLSPLHNEVPVPTFESHARDPKAKEFFRNTMLLNAPIHRVFDVMSDVSFRHHWQVGLKDSRELNGAITHEGSTHRCVINDNTNDPFQVSHDFKFSEDKITWVDTDIINSVDTVIRLHRVNTSETFVTMAAFANFNALKTFILKLLLVKRLSNLNRKSLVKLNDYLQELQAEGREHDSRIVAPGS